MYANDDNECYTNLLFIIIIYEQTLRKHSVHYYCYKHDRERNNKKNSKDKHSIFTTDVNNTLLIL